MLALNVVSFKETELSFLTCFTLDDLKLYLKSEQDMSTLVTTVRTFSDDIGMTFAFSKCATLVVNHGKVADCTDIELPEGTIEALLISSAYKYLGAL